ncbi:hypothetical protein DY023_01885 [Microbacterium bovistercoris]|uniref:Transcriptional regulator n=1 Tax=Microbacterium bovistercoris TaxID=2293570 RepID=A0A371NXK9_9MICO|nr:hypothetical protein [Microbacterium bovistercoris]REJ08039.1 hypothetical protein DY023_01885 [Microbacterium bovistercoris]
MKQTERLWRTLADSALEGRRTWPDVTVLADAADLANGAAHHALRRLVDIGAVEVRRRGGVTVLSPEKVLIQLCGYRNLINDTLAVTSRRAVNDLLTHRPEAITLGGADAAIHWLGGRNTVADVGFRLAYVDENLTDDWPLILPAGEEVRVVSRDAVGRRTWRSGFTSRAQTYADLFALPGWQASEFRLALHRELFGAADWDQKEPTGE